MRDDIFTSQRLGKVLPKAQKIIIFGGLFVAISLFIYALVFMTPFSDLYQVDGPFLYTKMYNFGLTKEMFAHLEESAFCYQIASGKAVGLNMGYFSSFTRNELQVFNKWLFALGFFGLIASLLPFVYFSQKRKIYYKTNLVVNTAVGCFNVYIAIHMLVQLIVNQKIVLSANYKVINAYETYLNNNDATSIIEYFKPSDSNPIFAIGYIIAILLLLFAVASILLTVFKYQYQKRQPKVDLNKVIIHE